MHKEIYTCDRKGCTSSTTASGAGPFFYGDAGWIGVRLLIDGAEQIKDFCALECLGIWVDEEIDRKRGGKK